MVEGHAIELVIRELHEGDERELRAACRGMEPASFAFAFDFDDDTDFDRYLRGGTLEDPNAVHESGMCRYWIDVAGG